MAWLTYSATWLWLITPCIKGDKTEVNKLGSIIKRLNKNEVGPLSHFLFLIQATDATLQPCTSWDQINTNCEITGTSIYFSLQNKGKDWWELERKKVKDFAKSLPAKLVLWILSSTWTAHLYGALALLLHMPATSCHPPPWRGSCPGLSLLQHFSPCCIMICLWSVSWISLQTLDEHLTFLTPSTRTCI